MSKATKTGVWFVRADNGGGSYPVTPEGWRVVWTFTAVAIGSAVVSIVLSQLGIPYWWIVAAVGTVASAVWFFRTARRHTDDSMTVSEYKKFNSAVH